MRRQLLHVALAAAQGAADVATLQLGHLALQALILVRQLLELRLDGLRRAGLESGSVLLLPCTSKARHKLSGEHTAGRCQCAVVH